MKKVFRKMASWLAGKNQRKAEQLSSDPVKQPGGDRYLRRTAEFLFRVKWW